MFFPFSAAVGSGRQHFPQLSQAEKRYLIKQNAAWAEKFTERQLARERVQAILQRRRHVKVGDDGEDVGASVNRKLAAIQRLRELNALRKTKLLKARQASLGHTLDSFEIKNGRLVKVGVVEEEAYVDSEYAALPYDSFVQDPYREDQLAADMAF